MSIYQVAYVYGPDTETRMATRPRHRDWLAGLYEQETLLAAGPTGADDAPGGRLVIRAESREAVEELLSADPYFDAGVIESTDVAEWEIVFGPWQN